MSKPLYNILSTQLDSGDLLKLVDESTSSTDVLVKLGYSKKSQYIKIVREFLLENGVDISHFDSLSNARYNPDIEKECPVCKKEFKLKYSARNQKQVTCSHSCANTYFRTGINHPNYIGENSTGYRNLALRHYGEKCIKCGYDKDLSAIDVHHIDRDTSNNKMENLIILCAICHRLEHKNKTRKVK